MKRTRLTAVVAIAALSGFGCKKDSDKAADTLASGESAASATETASSTPGGDPLAAPSGGSASATPKVKLLKPGKEPRQELRYVLEADHKEKMAMTMTMGMEMDLGGNKMPMRLPPIKMEMEMTVAEKLSDKEARLTFAVTATDVLEGGDPMFASMKGQLESELQKVVGAAGSVTVDDRGVNRDMELNLPDDMDAQMKTMMEGSKQAMEQMSSPLPIEPVGVGAVWEVDQLIEQNGLKLKQTAQFELVKLEGQTGVLKTTITQGADRQTAQLPNLPAGVKAELVSHTGTGTGEINLDLKKLVPTRSTIGIKTDSTIGVSGSGQNQEMKMKADTKVEIVQI